MSKPSLINENINRIYTFWLNSAGWNILKIKCPCCQFWFRHTVQKVDLRPCCLKEFALLAHESETSWFPYLFLSKSWRKTNCWNVYTARIGPCCVLEASLPRLRDKRFCVFLWGVWQLWTESICHLKCAWVSIDSRFLQFRTELSLLKSGPKFYCSLGVDSVSHSSLL